MAFQRLGVPSPIPSMLAHGVDIEAEIMPGYTDEMSEKSAADGKDSFQVFPEVQDPSTLFTTTWNDKENLLMYQQCYLP